MKFARTLSLELLQRNCMTSMTVNIFCELRFDLNDNNYYANTQKTFYTKNFMTDSLSRVVFSLYIFLGSSHSHLSPRYHPFSLIALCAWYAHEAANKCDKRYYYSGSHMKCSSSSIYPYTNIISHSGMCHSFFRSIHLYT